jgi:hypothetical protein
MMRMAAAIFVLSIAVSTVGLAGPAAGPEDEISYEFDFWDLKEGAKFAKYYRAHAHISPQSAAEPERILANGVRWRLLVGHLEKIVGGDHALPVRHPGYARHAHAGAFVDMARRSRRPTISTGNGLAATPSGEL